jgi:hypothetical protein
VSGHLEGYIRRVTSFVASHPVKCGLEYGFAVKIVKRLSEEFLIWAAHAASATKADDQAMFYQATHGLNVYWFDVRIQHAGGFGGK